MKAVLMVLAATLATAGCEEAAAPPAAPAPPAPPPLPELPMTAAKAVVMLKGTDLSCQQIATLRFEMNQCEQKMGTGPDDAGFRQEMADLRASVAGLPIEEIQRRCNARFAELERTPKPRACW